METMPEERGRRSDLPKLPSLYSAVSFRPALNNLHQQRKETAALRDLFYSRAAHIKQGKHLDLPRFPGKASVPIQPDTRRQHPHNHHRHLDSPAKPFRGSFDSADLSAEPTTSNNTTKERETTKDNHHFLPALTVSQAPNIKSQHGSSTLPTSPKPKGRQKRVTSSNRLRHSDVMSPVPYHTSITKRPVGARRHSFRALTQLCSPLPGWMDGLSRAYTPPPASSRDLQSWQNEIVKVVPSRPEFVLPLLNSNGRSKVQSHRYPYKVLSLHPASHFYRSWSKITDKEYDIHPDWSSEKKLKGTTWPPQTV